MFTISELKKHLGPGLGLRKNKYLIEIPIPGVQGQSMNILCRSAGLPERDVSIVSTFHKGRKYNMRGEINFPGTYEISILDDSSMQIRKAFDAWLKKVDNTKPVSAGVVGSSFENTIADVTGIDNILGEVKEGITAVNNIKTSLETDVGLGFFMGFLDSGNANSGAQYQTDVNIWQLSADNKKVYGYKLQNCFPSSLGIVTLDDGDENTLSEFNITFTYSEFVPLENKGITETITGGLLGDDMNDIIDGVENLFD